MPNCGAMLRPSALAASAKSKLRSTRRALSKFARPQSFSFPPPPHPSSSLSRLKRNLSLFKIHYSVLLWISLLLSLAPHHKPTMLFLMAASKFALLYEVLKKAVPSSWRFVHRVLDRRAVLGFFLGVVLLELWMTAAIARLGVAMSLGIPVVLLHAVFRGGDEGLGVSGSDLEKGEADRDPIVGLGAEKEKQEDADLVPVGLGSGSSPR